MCALFYFQIFILVAGLIVHPAISDTSNDDEGRILLAPFSSKCFTVKNECPNENVTLYLYRQNFQDSPYILDAENVKNAPIDKDLPIKILIHGYTGHHDYSPNTEIRPAYFKVGDMNVISLDYHPLVEEGCYVQAVNNLETVGHCIADVLEAGIEAGKISLSQIHIIGFSLGAHVAGFIQKYMKSGKLPRVTGLDPALPLFYFKENNQQLSKDDAGFVDSIHTNTGLAGKILPVGNIDFYVNGGVIQPGCLLFNISNPVSCDHNRAPMYYAESIWTKVGFYGTECSDYVSYRTGRCQKNELVIMGEKTPTDARGVYYVETNDQKPFALGNPESYEKRFKNKITPTNILHNFIKRQIAH